MRLLAAALSCFGLAFAVILEATSVPWLGLSLRADQESGRVLIARVAGPAADHQAPSVLRAVETSAGAQVPVSALDLAEDPDFFDTYPEVNAFFARQEALWAALSSSRVVLHVDDARGEPQTWVVEPAPRRPLSSLPAVFWFQIFAGGAGFLIAAWAYVSSPNTLGARWFGVMGACFVGFTFPASIYATRELALPEALFRWLSMVNHGSAIFFGGALVALFLSYPIVIGRGRPALCAALTMVPWALLDVTQLAPDMDWGYRLPVLLTTTSSILLAGVQWWVGRKDPRARAALRWHGTSVLIGSGLFVFTTAGVAMMGLEPPFAQGYAFGFFLLMYVGLALGLRRHRLLGLDEWAYRILLWVLGALLLIGVDLAILALLDASPFASLGAALVLCGFLYLPLRNWLWAKTVGRRRLSDHELFEGVIEAAFASSNEERAQRWINLLRSVFEPLEVHRLKSTDDDAVRVREQGLELWLPALASLPALRLSHPWGGRGLFELRHLRLAETLVTLMRRTETTREAFARGVREERLRIARDLHDNLGARLLSGLYAESPEATREGVRLAISDMRSIVHELTNDEPLPLSQVLSELRHETAERLRGTALGLDWSVAECDAAMAVPPSFARHYTSVLRELVSNAIRHASATRVSIRTEIRGDRLHTDVCDDGVGYRGESVGNGLTSVRFRVRELGGTASFEGTNAGTHVRVELPLPGVQPLGKLA